jgi:hypothetical protein
MHGMRQIPVRRNTCFVALRTIFYRTCCLSKYVEMSQNESQGIPVRKRQNTSCLYHYSHDVHMHLMNAHWVDWGMEAAV